MGRAGQRLILFEKTRRWVVVHWVPFEVLRLATRSRFPLRLERCPSLAAGEGGRRPGEGRGGTTLLCGEGQGEVSNSTHLQATARRSREIATYIPVIAPDIEAIAIYIPAIAADSRGIGSYIEEAAINWSEIATYIREIAADIQEMAANIGEIHIYTRRTAARSRGMAANSRVLDGNHQEIKVLGIFSAKVARATGTRRARTSPNGTAAWKRARTIVDSGGGHGNGGTPPTPPTPTRPALQRISETTSARQQTPVVSRQWPEVPVSTGPRGGAGCGCAIRKVVHGTPERGGCVHDRLDPGGQPFRQPRSEADRLANPRARPAGATTESGRPRRLKCGDEVEGCCSYARSSSPSNRLEYHAPSARWPRCSRSRWRTCGAWSVRMDWSACRSCGATLWLSEA